MVRGIRAARPEIAFVASYPVDSAGIVRSVREIGVGDTVKIFGGGMVGLQYTSIMEGLGSALNGILNYNTYVPGAKYEGIEDFLQRYFKRAAEAKVDPLGHYLTPFAYAIGQLLEQAGNGTGSLDHTRLAQYLRTNEMKTIVGPYAIARMASGRTRASSPPSFRVSRTRTSSSSRSLACKSSFTPTRRKTAL